MCRMEENKWPGFNGFTKKDSTICRVVALLFFLLMFALFSPESSAQIYKYVDKNGTVHFTDTPTGPEYIPYIGPEPDKKEPSDTQPGKPAKSYKTPSKGKKDLDDLDNLDDLGDLDELPPLPPLP